MIISFDTETALIAPGLLAPPMTCLTWAMRPAHLSSGIDHWTSSKELIEAWLRDPSIKLVGQNVAYDFGVIGAQWPELIPAIFKAYEDRRITDTMIRQQLWDIAAGTFDGYVDQDGEWYQPKYSLFDLAKRHTDRILNKDDWRMFYGFFRDIPLDRWVEHAKLIQAQHLLELEQYERWHAEKPKDSEIKARLTSLRGMIGSDPQRVLEYPVEDAVVTLEVYESQERQANAFPRQWEESAAAWWQHLTSCWGLRTDGAAVDELEKNTHAAIEEIQERLIAAGLMKETGKKVKTRSRNQAATMARMVEVMAAKGLEARTTKTGRICLDAAACRASEDELLLDYEHVSSLGKTISTDIPLLRAGTIVPVQTRFSLAGTVRARSSNPNVQNIRKVPGIRECFRPRPGWVYAQVDYPGLELHTFGQSCLDRFGFSKLADMLNTGLDPHLVVGASMLGVEYADALARYKAKDAEMLTYRTMGKPFNFGAAGGMGAVKFIATAYKDYKVVIESEDEFRRLKRVWQSALPETFEHFAQVAAATNGSPDGTMTVEVPRIDFIRGELIYTEACNSFFQPMGAACMKRAGFLVSKACYVERDSVLFGSRIVNVIHDELIVEVPEKTGHECGHELARLMAVGANQIVEDVPFTIESLEPLLMIAWSKNAKPVWSNGRLIPWTP